ncbi:winged helix-turn-helix transcriptional regulator [Ktedonobacter racemifer]|uniref:Transcriptional regulator, HxlR family n=1 Tax=Ktedonobacter racemifer DSM 44963 TaxID=485913 RepID=D6U3J1_KTERA|nr:helix-turn-helix domain-containing protein [Ktedonobacter racemifer]EFH82981.1 transcriptional regulator, HxlR family [Ktedonobacter racemifer DSM 44963]
MAHETEGGAQGVGGVENRAACGQYHEILEFLGRKWMGSVLSLLATRSYRFNELLGAIPGISDRMLTERLRDLETRRFVARHVLAASPIRVEYELTDRGKELNEVVASLVHSAERWFAKEEKR